MQLPTIAAIRGLSFAFILFLFSTSLIAQGIKIHERVEIDPLQQKVLNQSTSDSSSDCMKIVFTAQTDAPLRLRGGLYSDMDIFVYGYGSLTGYYCPPGYHGSGYCSIYYQLQYG
jgi:hypothetical protein